MSESKMSDEDILYCLQNLAGYEPSDIEGDTVEIAVNDDQFAEMSIVRTAQLGAELIERQAYQIKTLLEEKRVRHDVLMDHVFISHDEFKELAAFAVCNDSIYQMANMDIVHSVLNQIATKCLGFDDWINAYHAIK